MDAETRIEFPMLLGIKDAVREIDTPRYENTSFALCCSRLTTVIKLSATRAIVKNSPFS